MPSWLQTVAQFIPSTYFTTGLQPILRGTETLFDNLASAGALALTAVVGTFLAAKLFRWEKEEKLRPAAKLWLLAVLGPFFVLGAWQMHAKTNIAKAKVLGPRSPAKPHRPDPRCAPVPGRRHRDRSRFRSDQGRQDRRNLHRSGARRQVAARGLDRSRRQDAAARTDRRARAPGFAGTPDHGSRSSTKTPTGISTANWLPTCSAA